jgi:hypothetical protein
MSPDVPEPRYRRLHVPLAEAKAMLAHGQWLPWLRENCDVSARTAQSYMQLAKGLRPNSRQIRRTLRI